MPVYNEADTIDMIVEKVLLQKETGELIIVDDGSDDGTFEKISLLSRKDRRIIVIRHKNNIGKGAAVRSGLVEATMPIVMPQDADLEYNPADYSLLLQPFYDNNVNVVYGSRFISGGVDKTKTSFWHIFGMNVLTKITNVILGTKLTDEATCYKAFRRELIEKIDLRENGFGFCPEITAKISRLGIDIMEVPISYSRRSIKEGKKIKLRHGIEALWCLLKYRFSI